MIITKKNTPQEDLQKLYKEMEINTAIIKEYHDKNPFWKRYAKFLDAKKKGVFSKFISLRPKSRLG